MGTAQAVCAASLSRSLAHAAGRFIVLTCKQLVASHPVGHQQGRRRLVVGATWRQQGRRRHGVGATWNQQPHNHPSLCRKGPATTAHAARLAQSTHHAPYHLSGSSCVAEQLHSIRLSFNAFFGAIQTYSVLLHCGKCPTTTLAVAAC